MQSRKNAASGSEPLEPTSVILERTLSKPRHDLISLSFASFLFAEIVKYSLSQVNQADQLESRLHELGIRVGVRVLELCYFRDRSNRRDVRLLNLLTFVSQTCWKQLFGHSGELLKGQERENECYGGVSRVANKIVSIGYSGCAVKLDMINDKNLVLTKYITVPKDLGHVSCAAYAAGIVEGFLCSADFPAETTAHTVDEGLGVTSSTILIRFLPDVIKREKRLAGSL